MGGRDGARDERRRLGMEKVCLGAQVEPHRVGSNGQVRKAAECGAVSAGEAVSAARRACKIVSMGSMRNRVERKRQQQAGEQGSQPL